MSDENNKKDEKEPIEATLDYAYWAWLKPHAERNMLILVDPSLNVLDVGRTMAKDDKTEVEQWIKTGKLTKPTLEQITAWDLEPKKKFVCLVVQPFVVGQEI